MNNPRHRALASLAIAAAAVGLAATLLWAFHLSAKPKHSHMYHTADLLVWKKFSAYMLQQPQAQIPQVMAAIPGIDRRGAYQLLQRFAESAMEGPQHSLYAAVVAKYTDAEVQKAHQHITANIINSEKTGFCAKQRPTWRANLQVLEHQMQQRKLQALLPIEITPNTFCTPNRLRNAA